LTVDQLHVTQQEFVCDVSNKVIIRDLE